MKYNVVSSAEYTYPDRFAEYPSASDMAQIFGARGGYASFQVVLEGVESENLCVAMEGLDIPGVETELYALYPIQVEQNYGITPENTRPHMPEREAPYWMYDALMPYRGQVKVTQGHAGLYVAIRLDEAACPGQYTAALKVGEVSIPVQLQVMQAVVPEDTLKIIQSIASNFDRYHGLTKGTPEYDAMYHRYLKLARRMRQNMIYVRGVQVTELGNHQYAFDFTQMEKEIDDAASEGIRYFGITHIASRRSWQESTLLLNDSIPSMSFEGYCFLEQYLPALHAMLERKGVLRNCMLGVADEPTDVSAVEYRALAGLIRKIVPDIPLFDALPYCDVHGACDVWVPLNQVYQQHMEELSAWQKYGDEMWHYVCCGPRGNGFINRFMDYDLLSTRMLLWGNYKYDLKGYLHWALNKYQNGVSADGTEYHQDPFVNSCPEHHNADTVCILPAGDTHLFYPGGFHGHGDVQEPWMSIRGEAQRESAEEYELLKLLAQTDKAKADAICSSMFHAFDDIEHDVLAFEKARYALLSAWEK